MTETELKKTVCRRIKCLRAECGCTQEDVAVKCDISQRTVHNIEHEKSMPRLNTVVKLSRCFGVTVDEMVESKMNEDKDDNDK